MACSDVQSLQLLHPDQTRTVQLGSALRKLPPTLQPSHSDWLSGTGAIGLAHSATTKRMQHCAAVAVFIKGKSEDEVQEQQSGIIQESFFFFLGRPYTVLCLPNHFR